MKALFAALAVVGLAVGGATYYTTHISADPEGNFREVAITRGDILPTISATGTVEPEEVVDVGAQVAGRIIALGTDPSDPKQKKRIDYGSVVHDGTVLAWIDDAVYKAHKEQAKAQLARSEADLIQLKARLEQKNQEWKRAESLRPHKAIADTDYDLAKADYMAAEASVTVGKAEINQYKAALELAETNLKYTVIKSPVEGTIIDRRVNIGQTVVASLNAPSIFLVAKDLRRIQVWASVNEADIGKIHIDMPVSFTVDAYQDETFHGTVAQVRLNAQMTQNVVTYTVVVATDNLDGRLLPYLTANLQFELEKRTDVLRVPNAALRWKPKPDQIVPDLREKMAGDAQKKSDRETAKSPGEVKPAKPANDRDERSRVWVSDDGCVRPVEVTVGLTDGVMTEISGSDIKEGMEVVIGEGRQEESASDTTNPFVPKIGRFRR